MRLVKRLTLLCILAIFMLRTYCLYNGNPFVAGGLGILVIADCIIKIVRSCKIRKVSFTNIVIF